MTKDEQYYIREIKINEWLIEDLHGIRSIIRFANRVEYYLGKDLHNEDGAAIQYHVKTGANDEYYLFGERFIDKEEWKRLAIKLSRKEKLIDIFNPTEQ